MNSPQVSQFDFQQLNLSDLVKKALTRMNFTSPTPIQAQSLPMALAGHDLVGCAQTGTGKTAAFAIPMIEKLIKDPKSKALVLAPTRELALQISEVVQQLTHFERNVRTALIIGGCPMEKQLRQLMQSPRIIVATPGRLHDHLRRKSVNLSQFKFLVLDECDRMLDMGFEKQIHAIVQFLPNDRQTVLFSATLPPHIQNLTKKYLKNPKWVTVKAETKAPRQIKHSVISAAKKQRNGILLDQLNARKGSIIIFVNTKHGTNRLCDFLNDYGYPVTRIHGGRSQGQRNKAIEGFRSGAFRILVATDIAARGLDIPHIAHVINYDLPRDRDDYLHRIGRTARAGAEGEALCFVANEDRNLWSKIEKTMRDVN